MHQVRNNISKLKNIPSSLNQLRIRKTKSCGAQLNNAKIKNKSSNAHAELASCMMSVARKRNQNKNKNKNKIEYEMETNKYFTASNNHNTGLRHKLNLTEFHDFCVFLPRHDLLFSYWTDGKCCESVLNLHNNPPSTSSNQHTNTNTDGGSSYSVGSVGHIAAGALAGAVSRTAVAPL